jgi:hypothetical protein
MTTRVLIALIAILLAGCVSNVDRAASILADRPQQRCEIPRDDGKTDVFFGGDCSRVMDAHIRKEAYNTCAGFSEANEPMCLMAVVLSDRGGGGQSQQDQELRFMMAAMQNDTAIKSAWIAGGLPLVGGVAASTFQYLENKDNNKFLTALAVGRGDSGGPTTNNFAPAKGGTTGDIYVLTDSAYGDNQSNVATTTRAGRGTNNYGDGFLNTGLTDRTFSQPGLNNQPGAVGDASNGAPNGINNTAPGAQATIPIGGGQ